MEAVSIAQKERAKLSANRRSVDDVVLPIYLRLSEIDTNGGDVARDILTLIEQNHPKLSREVLPLVEKKLDDGKCLLLLDALDEVPRERRNALSKKLVRFARDYAGQIVCTSRIVGYGGGFLWDAKEVETVPFTQRQIEQYIQKWFDNIAELSRSDTVSIHGLVLELRSKPQILGLSQNPLLLSLLCSLYQKKELRLPARRCQIYGMALNCMMRGWSQARKPRSESETMARIRLLEEVAYHFTCEGKKILSAGELYDTIERYVRGVNVPSDLRIYASTELLKELSEDYGILQKMEREDDRYIFLHRTFQEYLTASYLKRMGNGVDLARKHFWEYDWHEILASFAGLMDDPVPLLQTIMKQKDDIFSSILLLAGRCVTECQGVSHPLTEDIVDRIYALWRKYPDAAFVNQTIVGVGQVMPRMLANLQEALGEREYEVAHKAARVIRKIGTDEAVDVLIGAVKHQSFCVRGSAIIEWGEIGGRKVVHALTKALNDADRHVREMSANTLASMGDEGVSALIQALEHKERDIRRVVVKALSDEAFFEAPTEVLDDKHRYVREIALDALVQALQDEDWDVRAGAAEALGRIGSDKAVGILIKALEDEDGFVRHYAGRALLSIGGDRAVDGLIKALQHEDSHVRSNAAHTLEDARTDRTVIALVKALKDPVSDVRRSAAYALSMIRDHRAVDALVQALQDSDWTVRDWAALALGHIGNNRAVDALIRTLEDWDSVDAALALGYIGDQKAVAPLIRAIQGQNCYLRRCAVSALGDIGGGKAVGILIQALENQDEDIRKRAVHALERIKSNKAVEALIQAMGHPDSCVRREAVDALARTENDKTMAALAKVLEHQDSYVRLKAADTLARAGNDEAVDTLIQVLADEDSHIRTKAVDALRRISDDKAMDAVIRALGDSDFYVRQEARLRLNGIHGNEAVNALVPVMGHHDPAVRRDVEEVLDRSGNVSTLEKLISSPEVDIFEPYTLSLASRLAVRINIRKEESRFIPVYPEYVGE